ncbi:hypothetical protein HY947_00650 [Candidatus Gottesmanbacteria bacterium]|nr:hypothetical protein [Candidatus Gottesmanbacteria bacterium]
MTSPTVRQISIHISFRGTTSRQIQIDEGTTIAKLFADRYKNSNMALHDVSVDGDAADWNKILEQGNIVAITSKSKFKA